MITSISNTAQKMQMKTRDMEIIANNLANINSTGYKRELPFSEILQREENNGLNQITDFKEGAAVATANPYDLSISGSGFFVIQTEDGERLTRDGKFTLSDEGYLVNEKGDKVLGQKGPVNLSDLLLDPSKTFSVAKNGEIKIGDKTVDTLMIGKIDKQEKLLRKEDQTFAYEDGKYDSPEESEYTITQGYIEESNVNAIEEMQSMIELNREFEMSQKLIQNFDQHLGKVNEAGKI